MKTNAALTITLFLFYSMQISASSNVLTLLHKIQLTNCLHVENCNASEIRTCKALMEKAFIKCDAKYYEQPNSTTNWAGCIGLYLKNNMSGRKFGFMMHGQECVDPDKKTVLNSGADMPRAAEQPGFFTAIGLDIDSPTLHVSPISACVAGAKKASDLVNQKFKDLHMEIYVSDAKKTNAVSGDGIIGYNLMLGKTTHKYGKCEGREVTTYLKKWGRRKAGDKTTVGFQEDIYVVIDCKGSPKPTVCD